MKRLLVIFLLVVGSVQAQRPKLYQFLDSSEINLSEYRHVGNSGETQEVDPDNIDFDLLNNLVFEKINSYRKRRHLKPLEFDTTVDKMAYFNSLVNSNSSFEKPVKSRIKFTRELKRTLKYRRLPYGIFKTSMTQVFAMNYKGGKPYFFYEETGGLVYGRRSQVNDESFEAESVEHYTYESLAQIIFDDLFKSNRKEMQSKYHRVMSVRVMYYDKTVKENRIPKIRASVVYGAPRLAAVK